MWALYLDTCRFPLTSHVANPIHPSVFEEQAGLCLGRVVLVGLEVYSPGV
jgi:hypothetical protein